MSCRLISFLFLILFASTSFAVTFVKPLPVDQAFKFSVKVVNDRTIALHWKIHPGYHLYQDRFKFSTQNESVKLGAADYPPAIPEQNDILGKYSVYKDDVTIDLPLLTNAQPFTLLVSYQGCSADGFCYPPTTKSVFLDPQLTASAQAKTVMTYTKMPPQSQQDRISQILSHDNLMLVVLAFLGFGLLLSLTPCVLPMIPILSGIIVGQGHPISTRKAFLLSLLYVLSMSFTYAIAGVIAGFAGSTVQAALQNYWVIGSFSVIFILLALSLFGLYEIQLPTALQTRLNNLSNHQSGGSYLGTIIMGVLATLIVSPCVTPPLIGALSYIGQTGNAALGGLALFCLGFGMGIPLLIIGTSGSKFLPKSGPWMNAVKAVFGVLMLAVAIWLLSRIIPATITMFLWAFLLIVSAIFMHSFDPHPTNAGLRLWKAVGIILFVYGLALIIGAAMGNHNPLRPLANLWKSSSNVTPVSFTPIKRYQDLTAAIIHAKRTNLPIMLDFYADWCVSCKEMEIHTFSDPSVIAAMQSFMLLQANVTHNDHDDRVMQKELAVIAPPTIIFFDQNGKELKQFRIVGEINAANFLQHLQAVLAVLHHKATISVE